jgi:hypothetical protein
VNIGSAVNAGIKNDRCYIQFFTPPQQNRNQTIELVTDSLKDGKFSSVFLDTGPAGFQVFARLVKRMFEGLCVNKSEQFTLCGICQHSKVFELSWNHICAIFLGPKTFKTAGTALNNCIGPAPVQFIERFKPFEYLLCSSDFVRYLNFS